MIKKAATILFRSTLSTLFVLICIGDSNLLAQGFDMEAYLRRKDVNGNGRVEPAEMSENTKRLINESGLNATKTYKISTVIKFFNKKNGIKSTTKETKKSSSSTERKVPGFGVDKSDDGPASPFGEMSVNSKVSKKIEDNAEGIMKRYDRNKNGMLDADEMKKIPWGSPDPRLSDLNKDGRMSRTELIRRLAAKEGQSRGSSSPSTRSSSRDEQKRKEDADRRTRERDKYRSSSRSPSPSSSSSSYRSKPSVSATTSTTKSEPKKFDRARYEKYASGVIGSYDKDKDGKLSKEEFKQIRRPPANADADKDGFVTKTEYLDALMGAQATSSKSSPTTSKTETKKGPRSSYGSSKRSSSRSSSFEELDANKDKQVQMHEYSSQWNDETVEAFYKIDRNGDGVITMIEWAARSN